MDKESFSDDETIQTQDARSIAELLGTFSGRQVVGAPRGARRLSRSEFRVLLKRHPGTESFSVLPRKFACYRAVRGWRGLRAGAGERYGAEFVFTGGEAGATHVVVVDPRTTVPATLLISDFFKRGIEYWDREYPTGWATSGSWLSMPPDCRKAMYSRMITQTQRTYSALTGAVRRYLDPAALCNAAMSPAGLFSVCRVLGGPSFTVTTRNEAWAPLFDVLETTHCRKLLSWTHSSGVQPQGYIKRGCVVTSVSAAVAATTLEITALLVKWTSTITPAKLLEVNASTAVDIKRANQSAQKRRASSTADRASCPPPACVTRCLYPENGMYAKNQVRYPVLAVIREFCRDANVLPIEAIDVEQMTAQWSSNGSAGGLAELKRGLYHGKAYRISCKSLDTAGGCPHRGNIKSCCNSLARPFPPQSDLTPAAVWASGLQTKTKTRVQSI